MAKRNALMARMEEQALRYARAARMLEIGFCTDIAVIALGRLGWGEKRLGDFEAAFSPPTRSMTPSARRTAPTTGSRPITRPASTAK